MTQSYIGKTKRHLAVRVQEHLSGKSAIHDHISSCKDCHSYSISNCCTISQDNTDFEAKIKEASYIKNIHQINDQIYHCGYSFLLNIF